LLEIGLCRDRTTEIKIIMGPEQKQDPSQECYT